jgi:Spy/CpxP family protein refolding chaperone
MKKRTIVMAGGLACLLALTAGVALAHHRGAGRPGSVDGPGPGGCLAELLERRLPLLRELDLDRSQREAVRELLRGHRAEFQTLVERGLDLRHQLQRGILAPEPDQESLRRLGAELGDLAGEAALLAARVAGEIRPLLTPEQAEALQRHLKEGLGDGRGGGPRWRHR